MAIREFNLHYPAPAVKKWTIFVGAQFYCLLVLDSGK